MDRLTSLTVFGRVVESGGFSAAARALNMSVTMVSNHVHALEDRLGTRLLNRTTRKVSLTETGRAYYERMRVILGDIEDADRSVSALHATPRGTLKLFTSNNIHRFLAPVISEYLAANPEVSVDLLVGDRMIDMVEEAFDLAIRTVPLPDSSLIVRRLTPWRHILCCAPKYLERNPAPKTLADLAHHNCLRYVYYPYGPDWRFENARGEIETVRVSGNLVTNSAEILRALCLDGSGIVLGPSFLVPDDIAAGTLVRLLPEYRPVEFAINAIYPSRHQLTAKVRSFIDLIAERFVEHRQWMKPYISDQAGGHAGPTD